MTVCIKEGRERGDIKLVILGGMISIGIPTLLYFVLEKMEATEVNLIWIVTLLVMLLVLDIVVYHVNYSIPQYISLVIAVVAVYFFMSLGDKNG
jgi:drug/metabolite transporter (DMT)-like permease